MPEATRRFLSPEPLDLLSGGRTPIELAHAAIDRNSRLGREFPRWRWPRICEAFAREALRLLLDEPVCPERIRDVCAQFRHDGRGLKGTFDVWCLHDHLLLIAERGVAAGDEESAAGDMQ